MNKIIPGIILIIAFACITYSAFSLIKNIPENASASLKSPFESIGILLKNQLSTLRRTQNTQNAGENQTSNISPVNTTPPSQYSTPLTQNTPTPTPNIFLPQPAVVVDTYITSGPAEGEVINDRNEVSFEFQAGIFPKETEGQIFFETKVVGLESGWQDVNYSNQRVVDFPPGPKEYTFLVRAKLEVTVDGEYKYYTDQTPAARTFKINTSPYFGKVKISYAEYRSDDDSLPPYSLITLDAYSDNNEIINFTGWHIEGKKGNFTIPKGIERYEPNYLLSTNSNLTFQDIFIKPGDRIYLSSTANPLGRDRNFRLNKCFGYLSKYYNFTIDFYKDCPRPTEESLIYFEPCCQDYILNLETCEIPDYWEDPRIYYDRECVSYLNDNFNYTGCYRNYLNSADFLAKEWHIYMDRDFLSRGFDIIYLRDKDGLLVDKYKYGGPCCD